MFNPNQKKKKRYHKSKLLDLLQLPISCGPRFVNDHFFTQLKGTEHSLTHPFEPFVVLQHLTVAEKHIAAKYMYTRARAHTNA